MCNHIKGEIMKRIIVCIALFYSILCQSDGPTLLQQYYNDVEQLVEIGKQHSNRSQYELAQPYFERARQLQPHYLKRHLDLWKAYIQQDNVDDALQVLKEVPLEYPQHPYDYLGYYWACGSTYRTLRKLDVARYFFNKIIESKQINHHRYWWIVGNAHSALQNYDQAIDCWQLTLELLEPDEEQQSYVILYRNIGHTGIMARRYQEAINVLEKAIALNPHMASSHDSLGTAYRKNGNLDNALHCYHNALKVDPQWANSLNNIGICYYKQGEKERAVKQFQKAVEVKPTHYEAHFRLGKYYVHQGNKKLALEHLHQAYDIEGQDMVLKPKKVAKFIAQAEKL